MNDLENWCQNNELSSIYQNLVDLEFKNLESLAVLNEEDIKELVSELNLKLGKKASFLLALEKLKKGDSKESDQTESESFNYDTTDNNKAELKFEGVVSRMNTELPETTFECELPIKTSPTNIDIHQCVRQAISSKLWNSEPYKRLYQSIMMHSKNCNEIKDLLTENSNLNLDMILSLVYYSSDMRVFGGKEEESIFRLLNNDLFSRDSEKIKKWLPFLFYTLEAFKILPKFRGTVYRGITKKVLEISNLYRQGSEVVWISFTSTSKDHQVMKSFSGTSGTWFVIECEKGIEMTFSLFPKESEILLFPNSTFKVAGLITKEMKGLLHSYPENFDLIQLTQINEPNKTDPLPHPQLNPITNNNKNDNTKDRSSSLDDNPILSSSKIYESTSGNLRSCVIFGRKGEGDGQFNQPRGIATDLNGNIHVCDFNNHRIQIFDSSGTLYVNLGRKEVEKVSLTIREVLQ